MFRNSPFYVHMCFMMCNFKNEPNDVKKERVLTMAVIPGNTSGERMCTNNKTCHRALRIAKERWGQLR